MWILLAMLLIMPFEKNPYLYISRSFLGIFPDLTMIKLLGLMGVVWAFLKMVFDKVPLRLLASPQARAFFAFVAIAMLSAMASGAAAAAFTRLLAIVFLLPIILAVVRTESDLKRVLGMAAAVVILVFPYAVRQILRYGGRLGVGLYEPNFLALSFVLLLPLVFVFARHERHPLRRYFWFGGIGILLVSIVLSGSRGGFVGLVAVVLLLSFKFMKRGFVGLVGVSLVFLILLFTVPNSLLNRLLASGLDPSIQDAGVEASNTDRMAALRGGYRMIAGNPLTGVGLGGFKTAMGRYPDLGVEMFAHNMYLELGAELGLPTLGAFLLILLAAYRSLGRSRKMASGVGLSFLKDVAIGLQIGLIGYLVSASFVSAQFEKFFWFVLFSSITLERVVRAKVKARLPQPSVVRRGPRTAGSGVARAGPGLSYP